MRSIYYYKNKKEKPKLQVWDRNIKGWGKIAGLNKIGLCFKTTRKTWKFWLVSYYPKMIVLVAMSMEHTNLTAMQHYLNISFTKEEIEKIKVRTVGWSAIKKG